MVIVRINTCYSYDLISGKGFDLERAGSQFLARELFLSKAECRIITKDLLTI